MPPVRLAGEAAGVLDEVGRAEGQRLMDGGQESHMGTANSINNSGCVWVPFVDQESLGDRSQWTTG